MAGADLRTVGSARDIDRGGAIGGDGNDEGFCVASGDGQVLVCGLGHNTPILTDVACVGEDMQDVLWDGVGASWLQFVVVFADVGCNFFVDLDLDFWLYRLVGR